MFRKGDCLVILIPNFLPLRPLERQQYAAHLPSLGLDTLGKNFSIRGETRRTGQRSTLGDALEISPPYPPLAYALGVKIIAPDVRFRG